MNIYELQWSTGEFEWVAAHTTIEALKVYYELTGVDLYDLQPEDEIVLVPVEKWPELRLINTEYNEDDPNDWETKTFTEVMKDLSGPDIIAGTMYL